MRLTPYHAKYIAHEFDQQIKETKPSAHAAPHLLEKLELQRKLQVLETKRDEA